MQWMIKPASQFLQKSRGLLNAITMTQILLTSTFSRFYLRMSLGRTHGWSSYSLNERMVIKMTYIELYKKCWEHFDPDSTGCIKGYPVMVLLTISHIADETGWYEQIEACFFQERILEFGTLKKACIADVLSLLRA